jgi:hypothetical protein
MDYLSAHTRWCSCTASTPGCNRMPNRFLPTPVSEVPNETYKGAADLVTSGGTHQYRNAKIVLSHSGESSPFIAARVAVLCRCLGCELRPEEIIADFRTFYFETALSGFRDEPDGARELRARNGFCSAPTSPRSVHKWPAGTRRRSTPTSRTSPTYSHKYARQRAHPAAATVREHRGLSRRGTTRRKGSP